MEIQTKKFIFTKQNNSYMKVLLSFIFLYYGFTVYGETKSVKEVLRILDQTITEKDRYSRKKEEYIATIKQRLVEADTPEVQYDLYNELFHAYNKFQLDSALQYVRKKQEIVLLTGEKTAAETEMNDADLLCTMGMYKEALDRMDRLQPEGFDATQKAYYFHLYRTIYGAMEDYALTAPEKERYRQLTASYRDSILVYNPSESLTWLLVSADKQIVEGNYREAMQLLHEYEKTCQDEHGKGLIAYNLSEAYRGIGDREKQIYYLAVSAIVDLKLPVKEYVSLIKLAFLLYENGEIKRAYRYLNCAMEDAVACNARLRTVEITEAYPIVDKAYRERDVKNKRIQHIFTFCISLLSCILIGSIIYIYRQMVKLRHVRKALSELNTQLQEINSQLSQSNQIKQEYIAHYLDLCTMYLDKLENYRQSLVNLASASKVSELFKALKSEQFIEDERNKFYREFDQTFLNLFPRFVEDFNRLLAVEERIYPRPGELLCTEIRIFALIRLGISDSTKIARFLRYSLTTIYNYRSKVRNKAAGDKNLFEQEIMKING